MSSYLPKLRPTIGGGLGGLPERRDSSQVDVVVENVTSPEDEITYDSSEYVFNDEFEKLNGSISGSYWEYSSFSNPLYFDDNHILVCGVNNSSTHRARFTLDRQNKTITKQSEANAFTTTGLVFAGLENYQKSIYDIFISSSKIASADSGIVATKTGSYPSPITVDFQYIVPASGITIKNPEAYTIDLSSLMLRQSRKDSTYFAIASHSSTKKLILFKFNDNLELVNSVAITLSIGRENFNLIPDEFGNVYVLECPYPYSEYKLWYVDGETLKLKGSNGFRRTITTDSETKYISSIYDVKTKSVLVIQTHTRTSNTLMEFCWERFKFDFIKNEIVDQWGEASKFLANQYPYADRIIHYAPTGHGLGGSYLQGVYFGTYENNTTSGTFISQNCVFNKWGNPYLISTRDYYYLLTYPGRSFSYAAERDEPIQLEFMDTSKSFFYRFPESQRDAYKWSLGAIPLFKNNRYIERPNGTNHIYSKVLPIGDDIFIGTFGDISGYLYGYVRSKL